MIVRARCGLLRTRGCRVSGGCSRGHASEVCSVTPSDSSVTSASNPDVLTGAMCTLSSAELEESDRRPSACFPSACFSLCCSCWLFCCVDAQRRLRKRRWPDGAGSPSAPAAAAAATLSSEKYRVPPRTRSGVEGRNLGEAFSYVRPAGLESKRSGCDLHCTNMRLPISPRPA